MKEIENAGDSASEAARGAAERALQVLEERDREFTNSILWGNLGELGQVYGGTVNATYTINEGNLLAGVGNSGEDPLFVDAAGGDVRLLAGSPALDAGNPDAAPATDILGNARDASPDLGAYEGAVTQ